MTANNDTNDRPTVSVIVTTYNHAPFIEQAIRGVWNQATNFPVEILIGEDCSTDDTRQVIEQLMKERPGRLTVFFRDANIGGHANFAHLWSAARGKYIAWLEGDDFWTDEQKLQRQVDALEHDASLTFCFHNTAVLDQNVGAISGIHPDLPADTRIDFERLSTFNPVMTCSVVYRSGIVPCFPKWIEQLALGDWPMHLLHAAQGDGICLSPNMATYRMHPHGIWSTKPLDFRIAETIRMLETLKDHVPRPYDSACLQSVARWREILASARQPVDPPQMTRRPSLLRRVSDFVKFLRT